MNRICSHCQLPKDEETFHHGKCRDCYLDYWVNQNAKRKAERLLYNQENKKLISSGLYKRKKQRRGVDVNYHLAEQCRTRINNALQRNAKTDSTTNLLGCSIQQLKLHLEKQFTEGMTWNNHGQWHIDHKRPCASFDLSDPEQQKQCFHYTNLQPLWKVDNLKKKDRYETSDIIN